MSLRIVVLAGAFATIATVAASQVVTLPYYSQESEPNDTTETAGLLLTGVGSAPLYSPATDVDYYRLDVATTPSTLTVHVEGVHWLGLLGDPEVWLESTTGSILAHSDDAYGLDCFFGHVFTSPGDYYVRVEHSSKTEWFWNHSNYHLFGDYQFVPILAAVRPARWMLYR